MGYSLFRIEKKYHKGLRSLGTSGSIMIEKCFEYLDTYDTLEEAEIAQKENKQKTLILQSF